jgi:hypothetical protein
MRLSVARSDDLPAGTGGWFETECELMVAFSARDVSDAGARALELAWTDRIEQGHWTWTDRDDGMTRVTAVYRLEERLPASVPVLIRGTLGLVDLYLSPEHFSPAGVDAAQRMADECSGYRWKQVTAAFRTSEAAA